MSDAKRIILSFYPSVLESQNKEDEMRDIPLLFLPEFSNDNTANNVSSSIHLSTQYEIPK